MSGLDSPKVNKYVKIGGKVMVTKKISYEEFYTNAIKSLRDVSKSNGIHVVFTGFNQAFKAYYGEDPREVTDQLVKEGKIETKFVKGGIMIYLPGEGPKIKYDSKNTENVLNKILGKDNNCDDILKI